MAHERTHLVSLTDAAKLLSEAEGKPVDRSTLSRYVANHADALPLTRIGRTALVDFERLRTHRAQNIRIDNAASAPAPIAPMARGGTRSDATARKIGFEADIRELDLAARLGTTMLRAEVEEAARTAVAKMQAALDMAINDTAERLAGRVGSEARLIRPELRTMTRRAMAEFSRAMSAAADADALSAPDPEPMQEAPAA